MGANGEKVVCLSSVRALASRLWSFLSGDAAGRSPCERFMRGARGRDEARARASADEASGDALVDDAMFG